MAQVKRGLAVLLSCICLSSGVCAQPRQDAGCAAASQSQMEATQPVAPQPSRKACGTANTTSSNSNAALLMGLFACGVAFFGRRQRSGKVILS